MTVFMLIFCFSMTVFATESSSAVAGGSSGGGGGGGGYVGGGGSSAVVPVATDYTVTNLYLSDLAGTTLVEDAGIPKTGKFFINASVVKNAETAPQGYLMLTTYTEEGQFLDYYVMTGTFPLGETMTFMATADNSDGNIGQIKAYVWNSLFGMTPLSNTKVYGVEDDTPSGGDTPVVDTNKISFTLDLYDGWDAALNDISYLENTSSAYASRVRIDAEPEIIFNGAQQSAWTMNTFFGSGYTQIQPHPNDIYSGKVTLTNNDSDAAYEVVAIEIATTAVVDQVNANGTVTFKNSVVLPRVNNNTLVNSRNLPYLNFASTDADYSINLTKGGKKIGYTELNEWDVLSIINANDTNVYDVRVLSDNNIVEGSVSSVRNSNTEFQLSDGNWYKLDLRGYNVIGLKSGHAGSFYINEYGQIVAFKAAAVEPNYAVILNAAADMDTWGGIEINLQVLAKSGEVIELAFAEEVLYYNLDSVDGAPYINGYYNMPEMIVETALIQNAGTFVSAIIGEMMTYETDDAGNITSIKFPQNMDNEEDLYIDSRTALRAGYDEESMMLGYVPLDENTLVFYITNAPGTGSVSGYSAAGASAEYSRVGKASELVDGNYTFVAFDNGDGAAKAVIIYNTRGYNISPSSNVAVIDSVGMTTVKGDDVFLVRYWMEGELQEATTHPDLWDINPQNAVRGDVFQMRVIEGVIYAAQKLMDYNRAVGSGVTPSGVTFGVDYNSTGTMFGAVKEMSWSNNLTLVDENGNEAGTIAGTDAQTANVYILDPNRISGQLHAGVIGEVYVDTVITSHHGSTLSVTYDNGTTATIPVDGKSELVLFDYVFAYQYQNDVIDIVIYKAYDYRYTL